MEATAGDSRNEADDTVGSSVPTIAIVAALGAPGAGTRPVATRVLGLLGVTVGSDPELMPEQATEGVANGSAGVVFPRTAIPARAVKELCERDLVRCPSLGSARRSATRPTPWH